MKNKIIILIIAAAIAAGGYAIYASTQKQDEPAMMEKDGDEMMEDSMKKDDSMMGEEMMKKDEKTMMKDDSAMMKFSGTVLAGGLAPLLDYNKSDFDKALASDKLVVVYFYANWCPECRVEFPKMQEAFDELTTDKVVGFRVNYNDSDTDNNEKDLAREHGVAYQHTKVFIKNGQRILKSPESWEKLRYIEEISKAL